MTEMRPVSVLLCIVIHLSFYLDIHNADLNDTTNVEISGIYSLFAFILVDT